MKESKADAMAQTVCFIATNHGVAWGASEYLWSGAAARLLARPNLRVVAYVGEWSLEVPAVVGLQEAGCIIVARSRDEEERAFSNTSVPTQAARDLLALSPDLVVISHGDNREGFPWMEFCAASGIRYVSVAHRASEWDWPHSSIVKRLRRAYLQAHATDFVSEHNRRLTERMISAPLQSASVVRNPFEVDYDKPVTWPNEVGPLRLACVARFDLDSKAHDVLLEVLSMPKWRQRSLKVDLVGRGGPHLQLIRELRNSLDLPDVIIRTTVDDVRTVWAECHGLILPSRKEGLPVAIVEAMLAGRPTIATDVGGVREVVDHGRTGWIAESPTVAAIDRVLEEAWTVRADWESLGSRAALQIRKLIPRDPAQAYADDLARYLDLNEMHA